MTRDTGKKRIVIWGTGFVGKMVIAEIVKHRLHDGEEFGDFSQGRNAGSLLNLP